LLGASLGSGGPAVVEQGSRSKEPWRRGKGTSKRGREREVDL